VETDTVRGHGSRRPTRGSVADVRATGRPSGPGGADRAAT